MLWINNQFYNNPDYDKDAATKAWANGIGQALDLMMACPECSRSYTVVSGDTLYLIAQRFLGSGALWVELTKPDRATLTEAENY